MIEEYLNKVKPYSFNITNDLKIKSEWKIQWTIAINFLSFEDTSNTHTMYLKSGDKEITIGNETNESVQEHFDFLLRKYKYFFIIICFC